MSGFVHSNAENVVVRADMPGLGVVEVHVSGQGFGGGRSGIERVGEHAARAVEREAVAVVPGCELDADGVIGYRATSREPSDLSNLGPFLQGPKNFAPDARLRQLRC